MKFAKNSTLMLLGLLALLFVPTAFANQASPCCGEMAPCCLQASNPCCS